MVLSPLAKKLQIKPGHRLAIVNAPPGYAEKLQPLHNGAAVVDDAVTDLDFVQLFVQSSDDLEKNAAGTLACLKHDGLLWICYRKVGAKAGTDLNRDSLWKRMATFGLDGVALVAIDDAWSAMRFRPKEKIRR